MDRTAASKKPHIPPIEGDDDIISKPAANTSANLPAMHIIKRSENTCFVRTKQHKYKEFTFRVTLVGDLELKRLDCNKEMIFSLRKVQATKELRHQIQIGVGAGRSISGHCLCLTTSQTTHYSIYFQS